MKQILIVLALLGITYPTRAQKNAEFRTGHLVKIDEVFIPAEPGRTSYKANYLIRLRDGSAETVALYRVTIFSHDYAKPLKEDTDIPYRISDKHLFIKSPEGHEIKAQMCEVKNDCTLCGSDALCTWVHYLKGQCEFFAPQVTQTPRGIDRYEPEPELK